METDIWDQYPFSKFLFLAAIIFKLRILGLYFCSVLELSLYILNKHIRGFTSVLCCINATILVCSKLKSDVGTGRDKEMSRPYCTKSYKHKYSVKLD